MPIVSASQTGIGMKFARTWYGHSMATACSDDTFCRFVHRDRVSVAGPPRAASMQVLPRPSRMRIASSTGDRARVRGGDQDADLGNGDDQDIPGVRRGRTKGVFHAGVIGTPQPKTWLRQFRPNQRSSSACDPIFTQLPKRGWMQYAGPSSSQVHAGNSRINLNNLGGRSGDAIAL